MAAIIDATVGGANSNSYVTLLEADAYFDERLNVTSWSGATDDTKNRALIQASRKLDTLYTWQGSKADSDQSLDWPRTDVEDCETGNTLASDEIPLQIKYATFELALYLLKVDTEDIDINLGKGIKSATVDVLSVEFDKSFSSKSTSKSVDDFISCLGIKKNSSNGLLWRL